MTPLSQQNKDNEILALMATLGFLLCGVHPAQGQMFVNMAEELGVTAIVQVPSFGSGISTYDFNQDGLDDITLCTNFGSIVFYENQGGYFELGGPNIIAPGQTKQVIWADIFNDGNPDLFITSYTEACKLYRNFGGNNFQDISQSAGLPFTGNHHSGASFGDYNRDGFLDLYICVYLQFSEPPNDPMKYNRLYRNNGDGSFTDVTVSSGIQFLPSMSFQSVWLDYNNDLWPDLYVINDRHMTGNKLFLNNGDGTFTDVTVETGMEFYGQDIMSNSISDYNHDGYLDVFLTNAGNINPPKPSFLAENYNGLFFNEVGAEMGLEIFEFFWGALWIDANNNGDDDLYIAKESYQQDHFYINSGNGFNISQNEIELGDIYPTYSPAKGDFNNNGYSDIAVQSRSPHKPLVLMNQNNGNNYIKLTPHGTVSNKQGVGSWIQVHCGEVSLAKYTLCGENYLGQNSQHIIFGVGEDVDQVDSLKITYTSGHTDTYYNLPTDSTYHFYEGDTYLNTIESSGGESFCQADTIILDAGLHLSYQWNTGDTTRFLTVSEEGSYNVTTTNSFGISTTASIEITRNPLPSLIVSTTDISCAGESSGSIFLENQTGVSPGYVLWDNGLEGDSIYGLESGVYEYTYTDTNGCSSWGSVTLSEADSMIVVANTIPETNGNDGGIYLVVFGGSPPFEISLNGLSEGPIIQGLSSGVYDVTITDSNGCVKTIEIYVESILNESFSEKANWAIYPNPVQNAFSVVAPRPIRSLHLNDLMGKEIRQLIPNRQSNRYDVSFLPVGLYNIKIITEDHSVSELRLIKI